MSDKIYELLSWIICSSWFWYRTFLNLLSGRPRVFIQSFLSPKLIAFIQLRNLVHPSFDFSTSFSWTPISLHNTEQGSANVTVSFTHHTTASPQGMCIIWKERPCHRSSLVHTAMLLSWFGTAYLAKHYS